MNSEKKKLPKIDYGIIFTLILLTIFSLVTIYSAQTTAQYKESNFIMGQLRWYVISIVAIAIIIRFDSDQLKKISWYLYGIGLFMLFVLFVAPGNLSFAREVNGAQSWFFTPLGSVQPSEFMKLFTILVLARVISDHNHKFIYKTIKSDMWLLVKLGLIIAPPSFLVLIQPDLGTTLVFIAILFAVILVSGISWKILVPLFSFITVLAGALLYIAIWHYELLQGVLEPHQYRRIYSWLDPYSYRTDEGMQLIQSLLSVGSGQTTGKGFGNREVYISESHSDFIFSTIGEEFGFIGGSILISLFFLLIYQIMRTGIATNNSFYSYICAGVIGMLTFHVFQNIGMTVQLLPITGIPLPFISYGGSSLLSNMMTIAVMLSIRYHYKKYMFSSDPES